MLTNERTIVIKEKTLQALKPTRIRVLLTDRKHLPGGLSNDNSARCTYAEWHERTRSQGRIYPKRMSDTSLSE